MEKSCENIELMLVDYADGQLSPSDSSMVGEHLAQCEECRNVLDALEKSLELKPDHHPGDDDQKARAVTQV